MASQQAYQVYAQNKGTLVPGQTISVNKFTVQVERYLSQGGFAHVYLVRTPTPVYNTTHHVLKRIAVANESMLSEVKREVDVMRVLKGHPNIVHLIDAAWHRTPDGMYEVFILMEYCPGGGIIDMMNRRLRERLTEAEILQIFVDVCEGVAFMHNSRPPLLHRDLKVENILQSSPTSYKLCDFGSAATVQRPPSTTQEIRAVEADLSRHTTIQYRAPEMIDLYSKRPIDEKSDVWALGVLLYKLCYYTTPFEEHGSLAILNVQYRIPPYPVYSSQMNMLIASMLREHGSQRPTVFELLNHVHYLRGTKSQFSYNVPVSQSLMPRQHQQTVKPPPSPNSANAVQLTGNHGATYQIPNGSRSTNVNSESPPKNQGAQAREKVLEAIAPMRRGRPNASQPSSSRQPSPQRNPLPPPTSSVQQGPSHHKSPNWLDNEDAAWKTMTAQAEARERANALFDGAWKVAGASQKREEPSKQPSLGFESDFAEKPWRSPNPSSPASILPKTTPTSAFQLKSSGAPIKLHSHTGGEAMLHASKGEKDAFDGLGLMTSVNRPPPTLGEARKLRTGLAIVSTHGHQLNGHSRPDSKAQLADNSSSARPTPSPRPSYLNAATAQARSISPLPSPNIVGAGPSWRGAAHSPSGLNSAASPKEGMPVESRFPSLEELDAQFSAPSLYPASTHAVQGQMSNRQNTPSSAAPPQLPPRPNPNVGKDDRERSTRSSAFSAATTLDTLESKFEGNAARTDWKSSSSTDARRTDSAGSSSLDLPGLPRRQPNSMTMKYAMDTASSSSSGSQQPERLPSLDKAKPSFGATSRLSPAPPPKDWLTGDDDEHLSPVKPSYTKGDGAGPILREAPAKRASLILQSDFKIQDPVAAQHGNTPVLRSQEPLPSTDSPAVTRFPKVFPDIDTATANQASYPNEALSDNWSPFVASKRPPRLPARERELEGSSSADEGPEDPASSLSSQPKKVESLRVRRKGRQSSVHDLVDLWGGGLPKEPKEAPVDTFSIKPLVLEKHAVKPKQRPTSLMPPVRKASMNSRSVGNSPRVSPIERSPSPAQPSPLPSETYTGSVPASPSVLPTRSRPQSMFLFPSKSTDSGQTSQPVSLAPPEEAIPSTSRRRTSISDVVRRYEAIGGKVIAPQQVPPSPGPLRKATTVKGSVPPQQVENGRVKVFPTAEDAPEKRDEFRPNRIMAGPAGIRTRAPSMAPTKPQLDIPRPGIQSRVPSGAEKPESVAKKPDLVLARPSHKTEPSLSSPFPKRKPTLPMPDELSPVKVDDDRSSSPERPYAGVGKLIDQWQRKSEESENPSRAPLGGKSNVPIPKRAGLIHGGRG